MQCRVQTGDCSNIDERGAPGQEYNRMAQLDGHQVGSRGTISTITTPFERGTRERVNNDSSGTCADVRVLAKAGRLKEALQVLNEQGIRADADTYLCLLQECIKMKKLAEGKQVHAHIVQSGFNPSTFLLRNVVNMYAKCGSIVAARHVFDKMPERDLRTWTIMMAGYAKHGHAEEAFKIYEQMQQERVMPDKVTFISILNACAILRALEKGREVHSDIIKAGIVPYVNLENSLVDMYAKCGSMEDARQVFDNMAKRDAVSWNATIAGYSQHGCGKEAFKLYEEMLQEGVKPDRVTFTCILNACASLGALKDGKEVHAELNRSGITLDIILETALVDMYAKCGSVNDARQVFNHMAKRNVVSWNAMISGCAQHGCGREAIQLFEQMQQEGPIPNGSTFISVLCACSHVGLLREGCHYFDSMSRDYGFIPTVEHFGCMVDLLGRAGLLDEAEDFVNKMPIKPDAGVWRALLGACRNHGDLKVAQHAAKSILK